CARDSSGYSFDYW
nr:immunoglobulin heavy chain junction region [Mus musculus]MBK4198121.1 immunoglobulin heavy chain junction region [Mus musculus]